MPWKQSSVMDERMRFVVRLKDGETMASLCREFGISRKTGCKIFVRYQRAAPAACRQDSRRLYHSRRAGSPWAGPADGPATHGQNFRVANPWVFFLIATKIQMPG